MSDYKVYAVDFDGTLCIDDYPRIGNPRSRIIGYVKSLQQKGNKLILWTCREGELLQQAVDWCATHGLIFDAVNSNIQERIEQYGTDPRKVGADIYIDDRAICL